jgi:hypothetical protein
MTTSVPVSASAPSAATSPKRRAPLRLLVPSRSVAHAFNVAVVAALVLMPFYAERSWWLGLGVLIAVFALVHGVAAGYRTVWLPGLIVVIACVQWVLAAWSDYDVSGRMAVGPDDYFRFAVGTTLAFVLGLYAPLWNAASVPPEETAPLKPVSARLMERTSTIMVAGGAVVRVAVVPFMPTSVRYAVYMVSLLSMVGALTLLLLGARRWPLWAIVAFAPIAFGNATDLQFLDSFQYILCVACVAVYRFRPKKSLLLVLSLPAIAFFLAVSAFKAFSRDDLRKQEQTAQERARAASSTLVGFARQPEVLLGTTVVQRTMGRLNEGYITSRMLAWMPTAEPYAGGETLVGGARAALLPRVLDPNKFVSGGQDMIPRFTGIQLEGATAMGLSVPGEMYANFGPAGAILGTFLYGLVIGLIYRALLRRSHASILWWAWGPYLFLSILSPEQGFAENANHVAKSALIMWAFLKVVPAWRRVPRRRSAARSGTRPASWRPLAIDAPGAMPEGSP